MKEVPHLIPDLSEWPITRFYQRREQMVALLTEETLRILREQNTDLHTVVSQTIYAEKLRCKTDPLKVDPPKEYSYWKKLESELSQVLGSEYADDGVEYILRRILHRYSEEIHSNFSPKTFQFARKALTKFFGALYNPFFTADGAFWGRKEAVLDKIRLVGPIDHIRSLFDKGTVLFLPTHFSNLDSILVGYAIEMLTGLPAFSYGAGLNLYDYEIIAYYMSRLGAYKVDRRKKNPIYAQTLRQFSKLSVAQGLNSIFFPGGTRSRYGGLEQSVKMGLLSTLINAQNEFYKKGSSKKIIIVPVVISYHFVLEGDSLIDQHLRKTGQASYVAKPKRKTTRFKALKMLGKFLKSESNVTLSFGQPIDVFGYQLTADASSTKNGREIDIRQYFYADGELNYDEQRNSVYTRHLANIIVKSYARENVVLSSHLVSFVAFEMFRKQYPAMDIYTLLYVPDDHFSIGVNHLIEELSRIRSRLIEMADANMIKLSPEVEESTAAELLDDGLANLNVYHLHRPLYLDSEKLLCDNLKLLYYYHNRLEGYKLDRIINVTAIENARLEKELF